MIVLFDALMRDHILVLSEHLQRRAGCSPHHPILNLNHRNPKTVRGSVIGDLLHFNDHPNQQNQNWGPLIYYFPAAWHSLLALAFIYELQHQSSLLNTLSSVEKPVSRFSSSMALRCVIAALLIALANIRLSACVVVTGKISCLDCHDHKTFPLSGIQVLVKCDGVRKLSSATTEDNGFFEVELPPAHSSCLAKVLGGTHQLYATRSGMVSKITEARDGSGNSAFTTSTPLVVSTTCPKGKACRDKSGFGSSKTFDLPVPREWGLAPTSYYLPFIPIIGIP